MNTMVPFASVSDGELDYQMWAHHLTSWWAAPHLAWEGTKEKFAKFKSVVDEDRVKTERLSWKSYLKRNEL